MKGAWAVLLLTMMSWSAGAEEAVPLLGPKPVFVPGMYESESRNSHFQGEPAKSKTCISSADFDAFAADTIKQYNASPQFLKSCNLSETKQMPDGFAFAMDCKGAKTVITFRFSKDLVAQTIETLIPQHKAASSSILTMMRRVGDCPNQKAPDRPT